MWGDLGETLMHVKKAQYLFRVGERIDTSIFKINLVPTMHVLSQRFESWDYSALPLIRTCVSPD